jgi:hypothetical protein
VPHLSHLKEVVSLDIGLCPPVFGKPAEQDRKYEVLVNDYPYFLFNDLNYMISRITTDQEFQIIAAIYNPSLDQVKAFNDNRFAFKGYDLVEDFSQISAITDCGDLFAPLFIGEEISESGLIADFQRAYFLQDMLVKYYPDESHAYCLVWAYWKMQEEYIPPIPKVANAPRMTKLFPMSKEEKESFK